MTSVTRKVQASTGRLRIKRKAVRLRIRRAGLSDLPILVRHRRLMWEELHNWSPAALEQADREYSRWSRTRLRNKTMYGWLVEDPRGKVVGGGCVWLKPVQPNPTLQPTVRPYLLSMYTEPEHRGRGVASMIVEEALSWSRKNGYSEVGLHASKMGRRVYSRLGFKRSWEMRANLGASH